jgi:acyl-coenzyme A thioesterase 9
MRQALEISWASGYLYSKFRPKLCHISDIGFHKPVEVGSLLRLKACVNYTEASFLQVKFYDPSRAG